MGPNLLGFLLQGIFPPLSLRCPIGCFPPHISMLFDLVKLNQASLQISPFTHEGVKSSSKVDPFPYKGDFIHFFIMNGPSHPIIHLLSENGQN